LAIEQFDSSFFSIGSNDLAQYLTACDRTNGALVNLIDPCSRRCWVLSSTLWTMADEPGARSACAAIWPASRVVYPLLSCGLRELSVNPSALALIKQTIDGLSGGAIRV
jgi:phosphotransferase system enzyme I (PtsI)